MELEKIKSKIIAIRGKQVILDSDVAEIYGVETMRVNEAVKNNPEKFPKGYVIKLSKKQKQEVIENFDNLRKLKFSPVLPKAFSEQGLYMLATILKSPKATEATIGIIETFAKVRELTRTIAKLHQHGEEEQKSMLQKSGALISDIIGGDLETTTTETTVKINLALLSVEHTVKRTAKKKQKQKQEIEEAIEIYD